MSARLAILKARLFDKVRPEDRIHAISIFSALSFIALVVVATFPRPF